jgi:carboxyl-terminal processing protease
VTLWIARKGADQPLRFDLVRASITSESVRSKLLDGGVGLIKISNFQGTTAAETAAALTELRAGGAHAIILDLRGNPGGLLDQAVKTADLFVDQGTLVTTVKGGQRKPRRAERNDGETNFPMVVLVNAARRRRRRSSPARSRTSTARSSSAPAASARARCSSSTATTTTARCSS